MRSFKQTVLPLAVTLLSAVDSADAFWRMPCRSRTGLARLDPLMDPGTISDHAHVVHGGGSFGMDTVPTDLQGSSCTSCEVTQDKSAYWTPSLHFQYSNGTTVIVPQVGGMLAYYLLYGDDIQAFPAGFQMIAGDKRLRNFTWPVPDPPKSSWSGDQASQAALRQKALGFNCLNYEAAAEASLYRHFLPDKDYLDANCLDGLRLELMFPACWNGVDLDSSDHRSHVAYPTAVMGGTCPEGFETQLPSLFFETIWNTYAFAGEDGQFVLSNGDPTGYGYHGDFMMGWDEDFLQSAVDTCTNLSGEIQDCPLFDIQSDDDAAQCLFDVPDVLADDNPAGPRDGLPVSVPIQSGPEYATTYPVYGASDYSSATSKASSATTTSAASSSAVVPTLSYSSATSTVTDKYGGGILAAVSSSYVPDATYTSSAVASSEAASETPTTTVTVAPTAAQTAGNIVATSWITRGNEVIEMYVQEVEVTVTATSTPTAAAKHRRHLQQHVQRRERHAKR